MDQTEENRALIGRFLGSVVIKAKHDRLPGFMDPKYIEHNPSLSDGIESLRASLEAKIDGIREIDYHIVHRILAQGNFVLSVCEGERACIHTAFYDLFRLDGGKIVEHWDTTEKVAPKDQWKNDNGKF